jgi:hypothetical protein
MSGSAAIHGTLGIIGSRGEMRLRFWRGRTVMMMPMHWTVTVVCRYCMA